MFYYLLRLIAGFAAYFVVGAVIMKVKFNKTGVEMIPQKNFWFALPGLIKVSTMVIIFRHFHQKYVTILTV